MMIVLDFQGKVGGGGGYYLVERVLRLLLLSYESDSCFS